MAVDSGRSAVGSPSGVCNACVGVEDLVEVWLLLRDELLELDDFANLLERKDLVLLVAVYGETCGVVSSVFEAGETWRSLLASTRV